VTLRYLENSFVEANSIMMLVVDTPWFFVIKVLLVPMSLYMVWRVRDRVGKIGRPSTWVAFSA